MNFKKHLWALTCITVMASCSHEKRSQATLHSSKTRFTKQEVDSISKHQLDSIDKKHSLMKMRYLNEIRDRKFSEYLSYRKKYKKPNYQKGQKVQIFKNLNFDEGEWRMVFRYDHPLPFLKYGQVMSKEELKPRLKQAGFHKHNDMKTAWFPYRALKDVAIMKQMQKEFIFEYKGGLIGTPGYNLLAFQDGKLRFETYVVLGPEAFQGRDGYCRSPKEGLIVNYLAKFKEIDYDPLYFWTGKSSIKK